MEVFVIGGGPAGMISAIYAAKAGHKVTLLERNKTLGKKLLVTGNRRCNISNNKTVNDLVKLINNGKFLYSAFSNYNVSTIIEFFKHNNLELIEEEDNKMYPITNKSIDVLNVLINELKESNVNVMTESFVENLHVKDNQVHKITFNKQTVNCDHLIVSTGGYSFPNLGSDGNFHKRLAEININITDIYPCEAPLLSKDSFIKDLALVGLSLSNISLKVMSSKNKVVAESFGNIIFTHKGISGPAVLKISEYVYKLLQKQNNVKILIALTSKMNQNEFSKVILNSKNRKLTNVLNDYLPKRLTEYIINKLGLSKTSKITEISNQKLEELYSLIFRFEVSIFKTEDIAKAFVSGGGVDLKHIDSKTLKHTLITNLSFAGEVMDLHGPIGGYNLTIAFITGMMAGSNI